jgi:predicted DNA-binding protein (MmcQ/YjbR family)
MNENTIKSISGLGNFTKTTEKLDNYSSRDIFYPKDIEKPFLIVNKTTIELRTDSKLGHLLIDKYESVMQSRYFGRGGIEIVKSANQLKKDELEDLVRLSYNLTNNSNS